MNDEIGVATGTWTTVANFFAANPVARWLFLAWVFGWVVAFVARPFIRWSPLPDKIESHLVLVACIVSSAFAAYVMWPDEHAWIVATVMGGSSPFGYLLIAWALCWKWPELKPHLSLRKDFLAAVDDEPQTDSCNSPGDTK